MNILHLFALLLLLQVVLTKNIPINYNGNRVYEIIPESMDQLAAVDALHNIDIDIWTTGRKPGLKTVFMSPAPLPLQITSVFNKYNITCRILMDNVQDVINNERKIQSKLTAEIDDLLHRGIGKFDITFDRYYRYDQINAYLEYLERTYPHLATVITIGKSYEGRDLKILKISTDKSNNIKKSAIFLDGGIHAREWIAPAQVLYVAQQLIENSTVNYDLIANLDWYLLPVFNPDGYEYSHTTDRMWRKTRQPTNVKQCPGVDANRNFPYHWADCGGSSFACLFNYAGDVKASEPETKALVDFAVQLKGQLKLYLTFHSYGQYLLYSWAWTRDLPEDATELDYIANRVNDAFQQFKYQVGNSRELMYCAAGCSVDWFKAVADTKFAYTIELPGREWGFLLPPNEVFNVVSDTFIGIRTFAEYIRDNYSTSV